MPQPSSTTSIRSGDLDAGRAGIQRVFNKFLQGARRPLHHFAGSDAVDQVIRKAPY
jgi:hypothetical protein